MTADEPTLTVTVEPPQDNSSPDVLLLSGMLAILALLAFALGLAARWLPDAIPRPVRIVLSAWAVPVALIIGGFAAFVEDLTFFEWLMTRPPRAYLVMLLALIVTSPLMADTPPIWRLVFC